MGNKSGQTTKITSGKNWQSYVKERDRRNEDVVGRYEWIVLGKIYQNTWRCKASAYIIIRYNEQLPKHMSSRDNDAGWVTVLWYIRKVSAIDWGMN